ncbi:unnamed protein product, partial [marine sediment metagenome]
GPVRGLTISEQFPSIVQFGGTATSIFTGRGQDLGRLETTTGILGRPSGRLVLEPSFREGLDVGPQIGVDLLQRPSQRPSSISRFIPALDVAAIPRSAQDFLPAQATIQKTGQRTIQEQVLGFAPPVRGGFGFAPFVSPIAVPPFLGFPPLGLLPTLRPEKRKTKRRKGRVQRIAPSLTGVVAFDLGDIVGGPLPTGEGPLGVLPGQTRFVPRRKKAAKKKKKS